MSEDRDFDADNNRNVDEMSESDVELSRLRCDGNIKTTS